MKRFLKFAGALVGLALTAILALGIGLLVFDPNDNKDWIARKFQEQTGRTLSLDGELELSIYPWLGLRAERVAIGNAVGFSDAPLLAANELAFRIKLLPLLRSRYEIDTVLVDGLRVSLEVADNGRNNWSSVLGDDAGAAAAPASSSSGNSSAILNRLIIGGVDIRDSSIVYDDALNGTHYEIQDFTLNIGELVYGDPLDLRLSFDASSRKPQLTAATAMEGTVLYDMNRGRYDVAPLQLRSTLRGPGVPSGAADITLETALTMNARDDTLTLNDLVLTGLGMRLAANVEAADLQSGEPAVSATLDASGNDLATLFRVLQQDTLAQRISSVDGSFSLLASLDADLDAGTLQLPTLQLRLLNADIDGKLDMQRINSDTPQINGTLSAQGPDLPTLVEVAGMLQGGRESALSQAGRDLARVPNKNFRISTEFAADLRAATVKVPELELALLGATISGEVDASNINDSDKLRAKGQLDARGPDLPLLLQTAGALTGSRDNALYVYGEKLRLGVQNRAFTLSTGFDADLGRGSVELPALDASMLGFTARASLDARDLQSRNGRISGDLQLRGERLGEVLRALDQSELAEVAQSLQLDLQLGGAPANLQLSPLRLELVVAGRQIPDSPQTLSLSADSVLNLDQYSLRSDSFSLAGLGLNLNGSLSATRLDTAPAFDGRLEVPEFNARRFLRQLNLDLPPTSDDSVLQKVALSTAFGGTQSSVNLNDLRLLLDDSTITGSLAVSDLASMATQFTLNIDQIDADRYMAPATTEPTSSSAEASPLPQEELQALNLKGAVKVGALVVNRLHMEDIVLEINAANGDLVLAPFRANLYSGSFDGDIRLNANGAAPSASVSTKLSGVELGPLLQDFMDASYVTGRGNVSLSLSGSGADTAAIKRNLNGNGSLQLEDGVLQGVDVAAVLSTIETMIRSRRVLPLPEGGSTAFEQTAATLGIANGVVTSNDLTVKAPGWALTGSGTLADLNSERINFNLLVSVDSSTVTSQETEYNLGGYALPIACTGSLDSPRCLPDAGQIIAAAVGSAVQQRIGDFLQERLGGGQAAPASDSATEPQQAAPSEEAPQASPEQELLNRALNRLLRN
jgi:AsmA protein